MSKNFSDYANINQSLQVYAYNGANISFLSNNGSSLMINATEMAKPFGKNASHWLRNQSTKEYINELAALRNCKGSDLVQIENGMGCWMHEDVALEFARWLSPAFAIWTNDRIKELMTTGVTIIANDDEAILHAMQVLYKRVEDSKSRINQLESQTEMQRLQLQESAPKVEYYDNILMSNSTYNINAIAKELGMSAVTLNKELYRRGVQYRQGQQWLLYSKYQDKGYTKTHTHSYTRSDGSLGSAMSTVWTEKGREFILKLMSC